MSSSLEKLLPLRSISAPLPVDDSQPISPLRKETIRTILQTQQDPASPPLTSKRVTFKDLSEEKFDDYERLTAEVYETTAWEAINALDFEEFIKIPVQYIQKYRKTVLEYLEDYEKMVEIIENEKTIEPNLLNKAQWKIKDALDSYWITDDLKRVLTESEWNEEDLDDLNHIMDNTVFSSALANQIMERRNLYLFQFLPLYALKTVAAEVTRRRDILEEMLQYIQGDR